MRVAPMHVPIEAMLRDSLGVSIRVKEIRLIMSDGDQNQDEEMSDGDQNQDEEIVMLREYLDDLPKFRLYIDGKEPGDRSGRQEGRDFDRLSLAGKISIVEAAFLSLCGNDEELQSLVELRFETIKSRYSRAELGQSFVMPNIGGESFSQRRGNVLVQQEAFTHAVMLAEVRRSYDEMICNPRYFRQRPCEALGRLSCMGFVATWVALNDYFPIDVDDRESFSFGNYSVNAIDIAVNLMLLCGLYYASNNSMAAILEAASSRGGILTPYREQQDPISTSQIYSNRLVFPVAITLAMTSIFYDRNEDLNLMEGIFSTIGVSLFGAGATRFVINTAQPIAARIVDSLYSLTYQNGEDTSRVSERAGSVYDSFSSLISSFGELMRLQGNSRPIVPDNYDVELGEVPVAEENIRENVSPPSPRIEVVDATNSNHISSERNDDQNR